MTMVHRNVEDSYDQPAAGHIFLARIIRKWSPPRPIILDIGCWSGLVYESLRKISPAKITYYGIDIEAEPIEKATKQLTEAKFKIGSALCIPYPNNFFNVVILNHVIEHIPPNTENICLQEICRVIKKNGILILGTPADNIVSNLTDPAFFMGHRHYSQKYLINLLQSHNFHIESKVYICGFFTLLQYLLQMFNKHILKINRNSFSINAYLEKKVEAELNSGKGFLSHLIIPKYYGR